MRPVSPAPISAPVCPGNSNHQSWTRWLGQELSPFAEAASKAGSVTDNQGRGEQLHYSRIGATIVYEYTGSGGVDFDVNGVLISIPTQTTPTTINSFKLVRE